MGTETNAGLLGYGCELGRLEPGRLADLVLLDFEKMISPFTDPVRDPIEVLLYRGKSRHVHTVVVNGRIVVEGGEVLTIDEKTIEKRVGEAASRPKTEAEVALSRAVGELRRAVVRFYENWPSKIETRPFFTANSRTPDALK
jgi:adenine deaminase